MVLVRKTLGWILILQAFNFGVDILIGFGRLFNGSPKGFVSSLLDIPLNFFQMFFYATGFLRIIIFVVGIWLVSKTVLIIKGKRF